MVTSEKLAARTYPGIQELHSRLKEYIYTLSPRHSPISHPPERVPFPRPFHNTLYTSPFDSVCSAVKNLLLRVDQLSADARITLHTTLNNPHHFVAFILPYFYNSETLLLLSTLNNTSTMPILNTGVVSLLHPSYILISHYYGQKFKMRNQNFGSSLGT